MPSIASLTSLNYLDPLDYAPSAEPPPTDPLQAWFDVVAPVGEHSDLDVQDPHVLQTEDYAGIEARCWAASSGVFGRATTPAYDFSKALRERNALE